MRIVAVFILTAVITLTVTITLSWPAAAPTMRYVHPGSRRTPQDEIFMPFEGGGIHHMRDVCIEPDPLARKVEIDPYWEVGNTLDLPRKLIVIYNSAEDKTVSLKVGPASQVDSHLQLPRIRDWPLTLRTGPTPSTHTYKDHPAYFMITTYPGNMYHFVRDSLSQLYWTMRATNRLNSTTPNMVYFREPLSELHQKVNGTTRSLNTASFAPLLTSFSVRPDFESYHKAPDNICYRNAIFGQGEGVSSAEVAQYVINKLMFDVRCGEGPAVTILQRTYRQFANAEELKSAAIKAGFNTTVVNFDNLTFTEQLSHITCTDILVGVQGAGLQWGMFLRPKSALLEIAWPSKAWYFLYSTPRINHDHINAFQLEASEIKFNFDSLSRMCNGYQPYSEEEKSELASQKPVFGSCSQWKWADGVVNPDEFTNKLSEISSSIAHNEILSKYLWIPLIVSIVFWLT